jgi:hypothetical protein
MEIEKIKKRNPYYLSKWKNLRKSMDDDTYGEIYESDVRSLILNYCESKGYEVEGLSVSKKRT